MNDQGRLSRNPISVLLFFALVEIAGSQLLFGPEGSRPILTLAHPAQVTFAWALLLGALLSLLGAAMPEPRAYWLEAAGKALCAVTLFVYTFTLTDFVSSWNTSMAFVFAAVAVACVLRLIHLTVLILFNFYPRLFVTVTRLYGHVLNWFHK